MDDTLVFYGDAVKALEDGKDGESGKIGGFLVVHSTHRDPDLVRDFFDRATDYGPHKSTPILYDHGFDTKLKSRVLGMAQIEVRDAGVWLEGQLDLRDDYERSIHQMVLDGKLGWSSGTASHLVEREAVGKSYHIIQWPLGLDASLTPTPAEPRTRAVTLKSIAIGREINTAVEAPDKLRAFERLLRDVAGYSKSEAEQIARMGFKHFIGLRDVGDEHAMHAMFAKQRSRLLANHLSREAELRTLAVGGQ